MSSDARIWYDPQQRGYNWHGNADGCTEQFDGDLREVIDAVEDAYGEGLWWHPVEYRAEDGRFIMHAYHWPRNGIGMYIE